MNDKKVTRTVNEEKALQAIVDVINERWSGYAASGYRDQSLYRSYQNARNAWADVSGAGWAPSGSTGHVEQPREGETDSRNTPISKEQEDTWIFWTR